MNEIPAVRVAPTSTTRAVPGRFEAALAGAAEGLARGVAATVDLAAPYLPGGTVLAGAIHGSVAGATGGGLVGAGGPDRGAPSLETGLAGAPASEADVLTQTRALQAEARTFNLQYLQLQETMQRESREFTALSNVMKVKHDSARAAIQNIH